MIEALQLIKHRVIARITDHYRLNGTVRIVMDERADNFIKFTIRLSLVIPDTGSIYFLEAMVRMLYRSLEVGNDTINIVVNYYDNYYSEGDNKFEQSVENPDVFDDLSNRCYKSITNYFDYRSNYKACKNYLV